jgi:hypothetical protein
MRRYIHETTTILPPERLYRAITVINRWPEWDDALETAALDAPVFHGAKFFIRLKGGTKRQMLIETADAPDRFVDVAYLPLARVRTARDFTANAGGTLVSTKIEIWGPTAFLWDRTTARRQAARIKPLTESFLKFAETFA